MAKLPRLIAWLNPEQEPILRDVLEIRDLYWGGLELTAIGSQTSADAGRLSESFGVTKFDDLRQAIVESGADLLWLAAPLPIGGDERRLIREMKLRTISSEPCPGTITDLIADPDDAATARFVPLMRRSAGFRETQEIMEDSPAPQCVNITLRAAPHQGTLFARLFDAMDLIDHLLGNVESISASLSVPTPVPAAAYAVPESLFNLRGHMTVNFHFSDNSCAAASISNAAGDWFRGITVLTESNCLRITDTECQWSDNTGDDAHRRMKVSPPAPSPSPGELIGQQISRLLGELDLDDPPPDYARLLALCEAARLSCKTGQAESPARMLKMLSHV